MTYKLVRPGISLRGSDRFSPNTPEYPFRWEAPQVGDTVWVIVEDSETEGLAIDRDTISLVSDSYDEALATYEYRRKILAGEIEWPEYEGIRVDISPEDVKMPIAKSTYLRDYWLTKYNNGHGNDFGETIYRSFEEARSVFIQYFTADHIQYNELLLADEEQLRPS